MNCINLRTAIKTFRLNSRDINLGRRCGNTSLHVLEVLVPECVLASRSLGKHQSCLVNGGVANMVSYLSNLINQTQNVNTCTIIALNCTLNVVSLCVRVWESGRLSDEALLGQIPSSYQLE